MKTPEASTSSRIRLAFTRSEAAAALGVSPVTIDRLTRRRLLAPSRATRRPLYPLGELQRFLRDTTAGTPAPTPKPLSHAVAVSAAVNSAGDPTHKQRTNP